eukprot:TRINITY_DN12342_c0_g1_i1.p1 TRINITY_DN12342_c0_g1~~TRINITY_DN12342_c0_g1_i1.p1  ORF type:complete len:579 (+),score=147.64 TRINITY_DN12342_c0_g1_i1:105-1841(+)
MHNDMKKALTLVNPIGDLQLFISSVPKVHTSNLFDKVGTEISQDGSLEEPKPGSVKRDEEELGEDVRTAIESAWQKVITASKPVSTEKLSYFLEIEAHKDYFIESILKRGCRQDVKNLANLTEIGKLLNSILSSLESTKDSFGSELSSILNIASQLSHTKTDTISEKPTITLRDLIKQHSVWRSKESWQALIQHRLDKSLAHVKFAMQEKKDGGLVRRAFSISTSMFKSRGTKLKEREAKEAREETGKRAAIYSDLNLVAAEFALMDVDPCMAREVILQFSLNYNLPQDKLYHLLIDHESSLILRRKQKVTAKELKLVKEEKISKILKRYDSAISVMKYTIGLFFDIETASSLLAVSKTFNAKLKPIIYRKLIDIPAIMGKKRSDTWLSLFPSDTISALKKTYNKLKEERAKVFKVTNKLMEEFIHSDVSRSFYAHSEGTKLSIMSILRCYAIHNPEVEYCQGINFFAGILFLVIKSEDTAFALFCELVKKHELDKIYRDDVPLVRQHLYQITKLIAIYLPRLHKHLLEEGTNPNYFCTPWFLTAFTFTLQYSKSLAISPLLMTIFDKFLLVLHSPYS